MSTHPYALPIGTRIAGYEIVRVIGRGGFGIVYEAYNPDTEVRVAIKEFLPAAIASRHGGTIILNDERERDTFDSVLRSYRKTALIQRKFDHPSILKVIDYIGEENTGYMITEYVDGHPLAKMWVDKSGHISSAEELRETFEPVIGALAYLHERKHLHRDISPDNIMVDKAGRTILIDFGALKQDLHASGTFSSAVQLRPDYSPPEQQHPDHDRPMGMYTDIFALAGTMYFSLTGKTPGKAMSRLAARGKDPYLSIAETTKIPVPEPVAQAIDKGLNLALADRQQTIAEFRDDLGWSGKTTKPFKGNGKKKEGKEDKEKEKPVPPPPPQPPPPSPPSSPKPPIWLYAGLGIAAVIAAGVFLLPRLTAKQETPQLAFCEQPQSYQEALKGGDTALSNYVARCGNVVQGFGVQAKTVLTDRKFAEALQCINAAPTPACNFDPCLAAYSRAIPDGTGIERVRTEIAQTKNRPQCQVKAPQETPYCEQSGPYSNAVSGSESALIAYVNRCGSVVQGFGSQAKTVFIDRKFAEALQCINAAPTPACNFDSCLAAYSRAIPDGTGIERVRTEIAQTKSRPQCQVRVQETPYCEQTVAYSNATSGSDSALSEYVSRCGSSSNFGQRARTVFENRLADAALQCIYSASSCSFDHCLTPLQNQFPSSSRLSSLRSEIRTAQNSTRCLEVPNGTYSAVRGYVGINTTLCQARYDISNVVVQNGTITFISDDYRWTGTIDQRTGYIDIRDENILVIRTGQRSKDGISLQGHYRNARLWSGFCTRAGAREGYFRLIK